MVLFVVRVSESASIKKKSSHNSLLLTNFIASRYSILSPLKQCRRVGRSRRRVIVLLLIILSSLVKEGIRKRRRLLKRGMVTNSRIINLAIDLEMVKSWIMSTYWSRDCLSLMKALCLFVHLQCRLCLIVVR